MESVLELVADKLGWNAAEVEVQYQESGLTNRNYIVSNGTEKAVVRIHGVLSGELGIDRRAEIAAMEAVSALDIAPELLYFEAGQAGQGYMITRFIEGRTWESGDPAANIEGLAALLKKVHSVPGIEFEFSPYADIERWILLAKNRRQQLPEALDNLLERLHHIQGLRSAVADSCRGLCHNDPFANNFMDDGSLRLLDWEFAGMGDIMYDLACISQSLEPDKQTELLTAYFGYTSPELVRSLQDMDYVVSFWNAMWATTLMDSASHPDFDYSGLANYLFQKMERSLAQG
jgi:thiamine kinase-like enzyme